MIDPTRDDAAIIENYERLCKAGVHPPPPGSPEGIRIAGALARYRTAALDGQVLKAQLLGGGPTGSSSELHERTAREAHARGERGWTAVDRVLQTPGLMGGPGVDMGGRRAEFDPRNPGNPEYYEGEARDQIGRARDASAMQKVGQDKMLAHLKATETIRRNPNVARAMEMARAHARKKGREVKRKDFVKALRRLEATRESFTPVAKGALGGLVPRVVDLRPGRFG